VVPKQVPRHIMMLVELLPPCFPNIEIFQTIFLFLGGSILTIFLNSNIFRGLLELYQKLACTQNEQDFPRKEQQNPPHTIFCSTLKAA